MDENLVKTVLDTNILVSAFGFGGKPRQVLLLVLEKKIIAVTSVILLAELQEVLSKKLHLPPEDVRLTIEEIRNACIIVQPKKSINIVKDEDDNRVLETAIEGKCHYIVTGDKELLDLGSFKNILILTTEQFLKKWELTKNGEN